MALQQVQQVGSTLRLGAALCFVWAGAVCTVALADPARSPEADDAFRRGVDLAKEGKTCEAASAFAQSHRLHPARDTLNGLALAEEECGKVASAYRHFATLLEEAAAAGDDRRERLARKALDRLAPQISRLVVTAPDGADVEIDGEPLLTLGKELVLDPGRYVIRAAAGARSTEKVVQLEPGGATRAALTFSEDDTSTFDVGVLEAAGIALAGVGVIGLVSGGVLYASAGSTFDEVAAECVDLQCPATVGERIETGEREEVAGQVLIGLGVTLVLAGAGLLTWRIIEQGNTSVAFRLTPTSVLVGGQF